MTKPVPPRPLLGSDMYAFSEACSLPHLEEAAHGCGEAEVAPLDHALAVQRIPRVYRVLPLEESRERLQDGQHPRVARLPGARDIGKCRRRGRRLIDPSRLTGDRRRQGSTNTGRAG